MKFLCLTMCQGRCAQTMPMLMPTQDDDANNNGQSMIVSGPLVDTPNEPKMRGKNRYIWTRAHLAF